MKNNVKISEFTQVNSPKNDDLFVVSQNTTSNNLKSYSIEYDKLSLCYSNDFSKISAYEPIGDWNISLNGSFQLPNINKFEENKNIAVTLKYATDTVLEKIKELSAELYGGNSDSIGHIPSYVGQIITTNSLTSEQLVKEAYGSDTQWIQLKGRFLFGCGANKANNTNYYGKCPADSINISKYGKRGGSISVDLEYALPGHSHKFSGVNYGKFPPEMQSFYLFNLGPELEESYIIAQKEAHVGNYDHHNRKRRFIDEKDNGEVDPTKTYSQSFNFKVGGTITDFVNNSRKPMPNVHPFVGKYIWERTY